MTDWSRLRHAYGPATDVPDMIADLESGADSDAWDEVWGCLCHQETVYSASFAALPELLRITSDRPADLRLDFLSLAGAILVSHVVGGTRNEFMKGMEPVVESFKQLSEDSLANGQFSKTDFIYLLQAACAFQGDRFWGLLLNNLCSGEFPGVCPECKHEQYLVVGVHGVFAPSDVTPSKAVNSPTILTPASDPLTSPGDWLRERANSVGQTAVAEWMTYLFGTAKCPRCGAQFKVPDAIRAAHTID